MTEHDTAEHVAEPVSMNGAKVPPEEYRAVLRGVLKPMDKDERLAFLRTVATVMTSARQEGRRWFLDGDALAEATKGLRTVHHFARYLEGVLTLLPAWSATHQGKAREAMEVMAENI